MIDLAKCVEAMAVARRLQQPGADGPENPLDNRLIEELADLRARLRRIEDLLDHSGSFEPTTISALPPLAITLTPGEALSAGQYLSPFSGFYPLENDRTAGPFRWTGPSNEFLFHLEIDRIKPARLELRLLGGLKAEQCEDLMLMADTKPIPLHIGRTIEGYSAQFELPNSHHDITSLVFIVPRIYRPSEIGGSDDVRPLGVRFCSLKLVS